MLTHWSLDQIGTIFQTFSNAFSSIKIFEFWKQLHWKMGPEGPSNWQQSVMVQAHGLVVLCYAVVLDKHVYGGPSINMFIQSHNITQHNQTMCITPGIYCVFWLGPLGIVSLTYLSITFQIWWRFSFALIPYLTKWLLQNFAYATTAQLPWHVQKFVASWWPVIESQQCKFSIKFEFRVKNSGWNGPKQPMRLGSEVLPRRSVAALFIFTCFWSLSGNLLSKEAHFTVWIISVNIYTHPECICSTTEEFSIL